VSYAYRAIYSDTADYAESSTGVSSNDFRLGPEGTSSRMKGLVSACTELPSSGSLTWTLITDNTGGQQYNFCISNTSGTDSWYAAEAACEDLGGRLCTKSEYRSFNAQTSTSVSNYWTAGLVPEGDTRWYSAYCANASCSGTNLDQVYNGYLYRCCVPVR